MTEKEAFLESVRYGKVKFRYPDDGPQPAGRAREDDPSFMDRVVDLYELQSVRAAFRLMENMMAWSRTRKAGKLRMLCVQYFIFGEPSIDEISSRMNVGRRRVFQVAKEVRGHCQPILKTKLHPPFDCVNYSV